MSAMIRLLSILALILGALGCTEEHNVRVNCTGAAEGFNCTAVHDQGASAINACWTVNVTCANGTTTSGSTCADFQAAETIEKLIPMSEFPGADQCDRAVNTEVESGAITAL